MKVFLGGTCADSKWREKIKPLLIDVELDYFDPIVDDWNEESQKQEIIEREYCDFILYVITPKMEGVYSIAEAVEDSIKRPQKTFFVLLEQDEEDSFTKNQKKSLDAVCKMIQRNGGQTFSTLKNAVSRMSQVKSMIEYGRSLFEGEEN